MLRHLEPEAQADASPTLLLSRPASQPVYFCVNIVLVQSSLSTISSTMLCLGLLFLSQLFIATPVCSLRKRDVRVTLSNGTTVIGYDSEGLSTFQGIPYAQPPVGNLRLRPPQPLTTPLGTINATRSAKACPQLVLNLNSSSLLESVAGRLVNTPFAQNNLLDASEDCLTLNVITPPNTVPGDNLPVMFWIFGGAFELGWSSLFNGSSFVLDSIAMGKPVVWVAVNYRVAGFGLMPGKEVLAEGSTNLALRDQRLGTSRGRHDF